MQIKPGRHNDIAAIAELLRKVFIDDPVLAEYVARSRDPELALERFFTTELKKFYIPKGVVDTVKEDGKLLGVALWARPNVPITKLDELRMLPGLMRALGRSFPRARQFDSYDAAATPGFPHWYLYSIVVSDSARGKGVGSMLLDHGIERAADWPIYLESTTAGSRKLYERKGFIPLGIVPSAHPVPEMGMWRPGVH